MAKMLPAAPSGHTESKAELVVFKRLRDDCPDDWVILHSLGLSGHRRKPWAEADFVIISNLGVLVIEVKGGHIERRERLWFTNGKELKESPFVQAGGAAGALANDLHAALPETRRAIIGHAVAFPDVTFTPEGPDINSEIIYDERDVVQPISKWIEKVFEYWKQRLGADGKAPKHGLSKDALSATVKRVAVDFELKPSLRSTLKGINDDLIRLTDGQRGVMAEFADNPRIVVDGGAGTGKTWLAVDECRRLAGNGKRVLLTCYSKGLARYLSALTVDEPSIHVEHLYGMTARLIEEAGLSLPDAAPPALFDRFHPEVAMEALAARDQPWMFDALVVDEAQDLLGESNLDLFDMLVAGGISNGTWRMFRDKRQDIFSGSSIRALDAFPDAHPATRHLAINCRNTAEVATQTAILASKHLEETLPVSGPAVEFFFFRDEADQLKQLAALIRRWLESGLMSAEITILSFDRLQNGPLSDGLPKGVPSSLVDLGSESGSEPSQSAIRFSTVADFKGLESDAVIFLDAGDLSCVERSADLYVGLSRARSMMAVGLNESQRATFDLRATEFGQRITRGD
jgi:hypothetical protein